MNCVLYDDLADVISDSMDEIGVYDSEDEDDDDIGGGGGGGGVILTLFVVDVVVQLVEGITFISVILWRKGKRRVKSCTY